MVNTQRTGKSFPLTDSRSEETFSQTAAVTGVAFEIEKEK